MDKKWITPTDDMKKKFVYHVLINDQHYSVYDIEDAYHSLGSANGSEYEDHYFIRYSNEWVPFISKGVHRICWEIKYKQFNRAKYKWDDWSFSRSGSCEMWANGKLIYEFASYSLNFALSKAQYLTVALLEFPGYNFLNPDEEKGRKVWWHGLPATIQPKGYSWEISVHPDYTEIPKPEWWKMYKERSSKFKNKDNEDLLDTQEEMAEEEESDYINWGDAFHAGGRIDWFRK